MDIINNYADDIMINYPDDMDMDLIIDDIVQENLCKVGSLISIIDYLYDFNEVNEEYHNIVKASIKKCIDINKYTLTLASEYDIAAVEYSLDKKAQESDLFDLSYYNKTSLITKIISLTKFKNHNTLQSGIVKAIGGKDKINLDFVSIKEQCFNLMYYNTLMISSLRESGTNDKKQLEYIIELLIAIFSINILLNVNIEKENG